MINKQKLSDYLTLLFEFTEEEEDAILGFVPMTQDIFDSCITKCQKLSPKADITYQKLVHQYPDLYKTFCSYS